MRFRKISSSRKSKANRKIERIFGWTSNSVASAPHPTAPEPGALLGTHAPGPVQPYCSTAYSRTRTGRPAPRVCVTHSGNASASCWRSSHDTRRTTRPGWTGRTHSYPSYGYTAGEWSRSCCRRTLQAQRVTTCYNATHSYPSYGYTAGEWSRSCCRRTLQAQRVTTLRTVLHRRRLFQ